MLNTTEEARQFEKLRLQGVTRFADGSMDVDVLGGKANLTDLAAAIGLGQLQQLDGFNQRRQHLARLYFAHWRSDCGLSLPLADFDHSNWHMFQPLLPRTVRRADFIAAMRELNIGVGVHYPAMHLFSLYKALGHHAGEFPHAEDIGERIVTLPLFPAMSDADVLRVCAAVPQAMQKLLP